MEGRGVWNKAISVIFGEGLVKTLPDSSCVLAGGRKVLPPVEQTHRDSIAADYLGEDSNLLQKVRECRRALGERHVTTGLKKQTPHTSAELPKPVVSIYRLFLGVLQEFEVSFPSCCIKLAGRSEPSPRYAGSLNTNHLTNVCFSWK